MPEKKCPLCDSNCLLKTVTIEDASKCEVDVCSMCGTMYPRGKACGGDRSPTEKRQ